MKTRLFKEVNFNDGGNVLVVSDVLCKNYERNGNVSDGKRADVSAVDFLDAFSGSQESEIGKRENRKAGEDAEVDDSETIVAGLDADNGEDCGNGIAGKDTDDERNQLDSLFALGGAKHGDEKSDKTAENSDKRIRRGYLIDFFNNLSFLNLNSCIS